MRFTEEVVWSPSNLAFPLIVVVILLIVYLIVEYRMFQPLAKHAAVMRSGAQPARYAAGGGCFST